jgi:hypothetical protein
MAANRAGLLVAEIIDLDASDQPAKKPHQPNVDGLDRGRALQGK